MAARRATFLFALSLFALRNQSWAGSSCRLLRYQFEPDCYVRDVQGSCHLDFTHPDLGPQIAVWVESADGATFVDTLMVTNAVALYGIGNRPGRWDFRSGPRFPYGRRVMALPVWAHRRGVHYDAVVMGDGLDDYLASHMEVSSPEPYFCRPMMRSELVDAITCASGTFRSAKGVFDESLPKSFYPPRGDLLNWGNPCAPVVSAAGSSCQYGDSRQFALVNDLDVVAAATPAYDRAFAATWSIPASLAEGDYALMVEVSKEFDSNPAFVHPSFLAPYEVQFYDSYGLEGNVGQPSVVYRIPFRFSSAPVIGLSAAAATGYGDWAGASGALSPMDATISADAGSGEARLRLTDGPGGQGRVHLSEVSCAAVDCATTPLPEVPRVLDSSKAQDATSAQVIFRQASDNGLPVIAYDLRYTAQPKTYPFEVDESMFGMWIPATPPSVTSPGTDTVASLDGLSPETTYVVSLRARGACGWSAPSYVLVRTGKVKHTTLSGCVIATAAYGTDLAPDVLLLRKERDWVVARSTSARLLALLYADSAPPLAALVKRSETLRAVVRTILRPLVSADRALLAGLGGHRL